MRVISLAGDCVSSGKFIVLEGIDGSGTTTHANLLSDWLRQKGYAVIVTQEPSSRKIGSLIRKNIKSTQTSAQVDALLFAADRVDHLEYIIKPSIIANKIVISDRYVESTIAYQTAAGLQTEWVLNINKYMITPDLTIILDINPQVGLARKKKLTDKFERVEFLQKVREIYLQRAQSQNYPVINTERPLNIVQEDIRKQVHLIL
jgi:dTMP kinase